MARQTYGTIAHIDYDKWNAEDIKKLKVNRVP